MRGTSGSRARFLDIVARRALLLAAALGTAGCALTPDFSALRIHHRTYDGASDDLATAGLGRTGLASATPPAVADARNPTAAELRRRAIHANYRALFDMTPAGGYGVFYGPNLDPARKDTLGEGRIAGDEFLAFLDRGDGRDNVALMVQVPAAFDPNRPCIVSATSSGSRGVYGAIGVVGEWALKRGCAVAYTDKGTGTGIHDLASDTVYRITGEPLSAARAGLESSFTVALAGAEREAFLRQFPHRVAFKHAHSQRNPEKDWGRHTLAAIDFAFWVLNNRIRDHRAGSYTPVNTLVIAAGISNGGYGALAAAEQDRRGLIDAVVVSEPNLSIARDPRVRILQGERQMTEHSRPLLDYMTLINLYQPCASLAEEVARAPLNTVPRELREGRCASLAAKGLLKAQALPEQAAEAQRIIQGYGILPEAVFLLPSHSTLNVPEAVAVTYAKSYGRFPVTENLCGFSFAATLPKGEQAGVPVAAEGLELAFAASTGIPPTAGINLVNNLDPRGARENRVSISPSTGRQDMNLDGAICLRALATGSDPVSGQPLTGRMREQHERIAAGIAETRMRADLRGKPAIIVNGRADAILPPNHTSRAYVALNRLAEPGTRLRYYEITNAHHLDALNAVAGFDSRYVPLHPYYLQALELMWDHFTRGTPLPPSQVVRTTPRGTKDGAVPPLAAANLPPISQAIGGTNLLIGFGLDDSLRIPD